MNTYYKYVPNVFLAKCEEPHQKGEIIDVTTKYGKENESIVFNLVFKAEGFFYYSIIRADGFNVHEWAKRKAEKYKERAAKALEKSNEYFTRSEKDSCFLSLGEPIKVGHHSEKRHRKIIDEAWRNTGKMVEYARKADDNLYKADNWEKRSDTINLSMPDSIDYYAEKLESANEYHEGLKSGKYMREHSYSVAYAKKAVNDAQKNYDLALKLWGDDDNS